MDAKIYRAALKGSWEELNCNEDWRNQVTPIGNTVLHVHVGGPHEVCKTNVLFIRNVLDKEVEEVMGSDLLWYENTNGEIPLHLAARFGHLGAVQEFLKRAKEVNEEEVRRMLRKTNKSKDTALHEAARGGYCAILKLLVEADPSCPHEANDVQETPLHLAAERGCATCVDIILATCDLPALAYHPKGPCGRTILHVLVQWSPGMVHKIIDKDESLVRFRDDEGSTPLHCAAAENKIKHLQLLLSYDKTNESAAYIQDNEGRTPLHIAILHLSWDSIKELIKCRPDCIEIVDRRGQNVVHYAAKWACVRRLRYFLSVEPDLRKLMNGKDFEGNTPLHLVAINAAYITCSCMSRVPKFLRAQRQHLHLFNNENLTPVDILVSHNFNKNISLYDLMTQRTKKLLPMYRRIAKKSKFEVERATNYTDVLKRRVAGLKNAAQSQLVVAALVATVSFAAGFTVPGGLNQSPGPDIGTAVMIKSAAFKAFLVSDSLALTCSSLAVFLYFLGAGARDRLAVMFLKSAYLLTMISIGAMMIAFVTGLYVVIPNSGGLQIALFIVSSFFFGFYAPRGFANLIYAAAEAFIIKCPGPRPRRRRRS